MGSRPSGGVYCVVVYKRGLVMEGVWIKVEELEKLKQQRDDLLAALEEIGNTACGEASHQYMALAAITKVKQP